jgi:hypothetical protein
MRSPSFFGLLFAASSLLASNHVDAAAAMCEGICEIDLGRDCAAAVVELEFSGDCCALKEVEGVCFMVTTESCQYKIMGASDTNCVTDPDGVTVGCVLSYTVYTSLSDDPCPQSEFALPGFSADTAIVVDDTPTAVAASADDVNGTTPIAMPASADGVNGTRDGISDSPSGAGPSMVPYRYICVMISAMQLLL